jgi:hypothetical protein
VWAVIIGLVVLDEQLPPQFLGALGLILAGLAVSQARITRGTPATAAGNKVAAAASPPRQSR